MEMQRSTTRRSCPARDDSSQEKSSASHMMPYFTTSPMPSLTNSSGRVLRQSRSHTTSLGCQKAPTRFLPSGRSTAVLPPTLESTMASSDVATCTRLQPRM